MATLEATDLAAALLGQHEQRVSTERLMLAIFLADWKATLETGSPLTNLVWVEGTRGIRCDAAEVAAWRALRGEPSGLLVEQSSLLTLVLGHHLEHVAPMADAEFDRLTISVYPALASERGDILDLPALAREYLSQRTLLRA